MSRNRAIYVLIEPCWTLLTVEIRGVIRFLIALGPTFSSQVWSMVWLAIA